MRNAALIFVRGATRAASRISGIVPWSGATREEIEGLPNMIVWRPAELLAPETTYRIVIQVDNDGLGPDNGDGFDGRARRRGCVRCLR